MSRCTYAISISLHDRYIAIESYSYTCELEAGHDKPPAPDGVSRNPTPHQFKAPHMHTPFTFTNDTLQFHAPDDAFPGQLEAHK